MFTVNFECKIMRLGVNSPRGEETKLIDFANSLSYYVREVFLRRFDYPEPLEGICFNAPDAKYTKAGYTIFKTKFCTATIFKSKISSHNTKITIKEHVSESEPCDEFCDLFEAIYDTITSCMVGFSITDLRIFNLVPQSESLDKPCINSILSKLIGENQNLHLGKFIFLQRQETASFITNFSMNVVEYKIQAIVDDYLRKEGIDATALFWIQHPSDKMYEGSLSNTLNLVVRANTLNGISSFHLGKIADIVLSHIFDITNFVEIHYEKSCESYSN